MATVFAKAQETLITTDGEVIMVYIDDIGSTTIYYKTVDSANSQLQRIDKSKVYMIKRADGTKYDLGNTQTPAQQASTPAQPMNKELSEEAQQRNKELIAALNKAASLPEPAITKDKLADRFYATLGVDENSIISNDDIELSYETTNRLHGPDIILTITNKTNKTIFIDQANTFFITNGESAPYYVPTAYSSSTSKTGDANAGTFAGALGVHDYQTNVSTSTVYSQRVVSIPPKAKKKLDSKSMFLPRDYMCCPGMCIIYYKYGKAYYRYRAMYFGDKKSPNALKMGETFSFSSINSPLKFTCFVTYSYTEDCTTTNNVSLNLYMKKVIALAINDIADYSTTEYFMGNVVLDNPHYHYGTCNFGNTVFKRP